MDLSSASTYLNNLLAKSGLLKGGKDIPFHRPSPEDGSTKQIINLVHDLVQRREKEAEQLESLAITIRQLRTDNAKCLQQNEKLNARCEDLERKNANLEGQQKAFNSTLRASESTAKSLRDETVRLKMIIQQVRGQSANDIRKRDVEIGRLKEKLLEPRRNPKSVNTITITGFTPTVTSSKPEATSDNACSPDCIAQDTADALTELSQTLANENDNIVSITRQMLSTLKSIQGIEDDFQFPTTEEDAESAFLSITPRSFDALSDELADALGSLRDLVNQPNYVAVEEIHAKDNEISRLRARVATVEEEWRKAIALIDQWNKSINGQNSASNPIEYPEPSGYPVRAGLEQIMEEDEEEEEEFEYEEEEGEYEEEEEGIEDEGVQEQDQEEDHEGEVMEESEKSEEQDEEIIEKVLIVDEKDITEEAEEYIVEEEAEEEFNEEAEEQAEEEEIEQETEEVVEDEEPEHANDINEEEGQEVAQEEQHDEGEDYADDALTEIDPNEIHVGDVSLDEEQLLREASMIMENPGEEDDENENDPDAEFSEEEIKQNPTATPRRSKRTPKKELLSDLFLDMVETPPRQQRRRRESPRKKNNQQNENVNVNQTVEPLRSILKSKSKNKKAFDFLNMNDSPEPEGAPTPRRKKVVIESPRAEAVEAPLVTPKTRRSNKRALVETPETAPSSTRASKRPRKTPVPAAKKRSRS